MALTLLVIVLSSLAALSVSVSRQATQVEGGTFGNAQLGQEVGRLLAIPFDSLAARAGCDTVSGRVSFSRCVRVTNVTRAQDRVTLVLTPTGSRAGRPDSVVFDRTRVMIASPFNSP